MQDTIAPKSEAAPENPELFPEIQNTAETPAPQNENPPVSETPAPAQDSLLEKLKQSVGNVFEKHGVIYKRSGGRPRKDGMPNKGDIPLNVPGSAIPAVAAPPDPFPPRNDLDPLLVRRVCSAVLKSLGGIMDRMLFRKAVKKTEDPKFAYQLIADCAITTEESQAFSELAEICLRKYGVGTEYAPEVGLAVILTGVGVRYAEAFKSLERMEPAGGDK